MTEFDPQKLGTTDYNVTYCTQDGVKPGMDIYYPNVAGPWPAVVYIHGGGWMEGDKADVVTKPGDFGYLMASINYRMYPAARFPAMIEDVKCAIRFLRAHARQYNLNPERIGLFGISAGGHLAALAGLADESAGWDVGQYLDQSSRVQAVLSVCGPADLTKLFPEWVEEVKGNVFGAGQLANSSPVNHARAGAPPFLIIHGDADEVVPVEQSYLLRDALNAVQAPVEFLIVHNATHGMTPLAGPLDPPLEVVFQRAFAFLDRHLSFSK